MARKRTHSELEHLRGEIKALKSENRNLKKRLRHKEKYDQPDFEKELKEETEEQYKKSEDVCKHCGKGIPNLLDLGRAMYMICPVCEHREKV